MRLFLSSQAEERIKAQARQDEREGIRSDLAWASNHQEEISRWKPEEGNLPVHNGWYGISIRYAQAVIYHRQFNDQKLFKEKK